MLDNYIERYSRLTVPPGAPVMIEVQINGACTRAANPHLPHTHNEITDAVLKVSAAGASIIPTAIDEDRSRMGLEHAELRADLKVGLESHFDPGRTPTRR